MNGPPKKGDSNVSDDLSIASNASSVSVQDAITSIRSESSRRRARVRRIRSFLSLDNNNSNHSIGRSNHSLGRSFTKNSSNHSLGRSFAKDSSNHSSFDSITSTGSTQGRGIMTVRTQEESLKGGKITEMKKLRRRMKLRVRHQLFETPTKDEHMSTSSASTADLSVVSFDSVTIREYSLVPGDNPSVSAGPPLSLGWEHRERYSSALDPYELFREGKRRTSAQMRIPTKVRKSMLLQHGHTPRELDEATKEASRSRLQREYTVKVIHKSLLKNGKLKNATNTTSLLSLWGNNQVDNATDESLLKKKKAELNNAATTTSLFSSLWGKTQTDNDANASSNRSKIKLMG